MTKDKIKNRISMALKDTILQQDFEIICKNLTELEKDLNYQKQARIIAENAVVKLEKENTELEKKYKAKITQAHIDGYNRGKAEQEKENAEIKKKVIDIFANDEAQQGELWKACGLRLVGWDYEKNQLDDRFMTLYGVSN